MRCVASLTVALAAAGQVLGQIPVDTTTFNNIIQYTRFARASYADSCATPPNGSTVLQYFSDSATDAQATLFKWDSAEQIIISFRGTSSPADLNSDFDFLPTDLSLPGANTSTCSGCQVHEGFQKQYNGIGTQVLAAVKSAVSANSGYSLIVTGHSLGGGLASLGTASLGASGVKIAATYTYGEPRNGNSAFGSYVLSFPGSANYFRVTHSNDGVPSIPPSIIGFSHHGDEYWEQATGYNNTQSTTVKCSSLLGSEPLTCNLNQNFGDNPINYAHLTYSNDVIGNPLHIHDCGAPYP